MPQIRSSEKKSPELYHLIAYIIIPPNFMQMTIEAVTLYFFFLKVLYIEVTVWRVHQDSLLYNLDKTSPKGEVQRSCALDNHGDRVYRNTWCNVGRQRTRRCTKDTSWNPFRIWRETSQRGLLYGLGEPRSQFFDDVMDGGYPYPPSDVIIRHVTCVDLDCI